MNKLDERAETCCDRLTFHDNIKWKETYSWEEVCQKIKRAYKQGWLDCTTAWVKTRTIDMEKEYFTREEFYNMPDDEKEGCKTFLSHYQVPITPDTLAAFNMGYHAGYNYHKYETEEGSDR